MLTFLQFIQEEIVHPAHSLGIGRAEMPQVRSFNVTDFLSFLNHHGAGHHEEEVEATSLKPVQKEINMDRVTPSAQVNKKPLVSKDNYILDGHHRWYPCFLRQQGAYKAFLGNEALTIIRIAMNIRPLLDLTKQYPKVEFADINHFSTPVAA